MAKVLSKTPQKLVIAMFGRRIEVTPSGCSSNNLTETVPRVQEVFGQARDWFLAKAGMIELGPIFGETLKFWSNRSGVYCYATHDGQLGVRENPAEVEDILKVTLQWLG